LMRELEGPSKGWGGMGHGCFMAVDRVHDGSLDHLKGWPSIDNICATICYHHVVVAFECVQAGWTQTFFNSQSLA